MSQRKISTSSDKEYRRILKTVYGIQIKSKSRLDDYKAFINAIKNENDIEDNDNITAVNTICDEAEHVIELIESLYDNIGTQQCYLSAAKKIFDAKRPSKPNLYRYKMSQLRPEIVETAGKNVKMIAFRQEHPNPIDYINSRKIDMMKTVKYWCYTHYKKNMKQLVNSHKISMGPGYVSDVTRNAGALKMCSFVMAVLAISLQVDSKRILRAGLRETVYTSEGGKSMNNFISIRNKTITIKYYKTKNKYGIKVFDLTDDIIDMIKFVRLFNGPSKFIFSTRKGTLYDKKAYGKLYKKIDKKLTAMLVRKIYTRELMCKTDERGERGEEMEGGRLGVFTGNTKNVRKIYYDCESEEEEKVVEKEDTDNDSDGN